MHLIIFQHWHILDKPEIFNAKTRRMEGGKEEKISLFFLCLFAPLRQVF
jgi:hypothetical protein